jgi:AcrR family transcriptional regulator
MAPRRSGGVRAAKEAAVKDNLTQQVSDAAEAAEGADLGDIPGARRRRARRGEGDRLRAEIVDAASELLAATGEVGELSLRAVAREVGVAATSIYLHFRNLDELVLAVKIRYFAEFGEALEAAARAGGDVPLARARARARAYVQYGMRHPGRYRAMFTSETLPPHLVPSVLYVGVEVFDAVRNEIAAVVGPGVDARMLAIHVWTALHGMVTLRAARRNFPWPEMDEEIDSLIDHLLPAP